MIARCVFQQRIYMGIYNREAFPVWLNAWLVSSRCACSFRVQWDAALLPLLHVPKITFKAFWVICRSNPWTPYRVKKKVKYTIVQALRFCTGRTAHRGSRGIALLFHDHGTRRGWGVSVTPRPLFTPGKTRYPLYRSLGCPQGRSGQVRKISPPPGFNSRTV